MPAPASPITKGLYINSFKISATDTSPYTNLLGTDGLGANPAGGNKIDDLITYMVAQGYNYALLYGLDGSAFVNSSSDETFSTTGKARLENIIPRFYAAGIACSAIVNLASLNRTVSRWDGTSQVRKIVAYNNSASVVGTVSKQFAWITTETEFWRFAHTAVTTSQKVEIDSTKTFIENTWPGSPDPLPCGNTSNATLTLSPSISSHDYIKVINPSNGLVNYREIVNRSFIGSGFSVELDRPLDSGFVANSCVYYAKVLAQAAPDFKTFLYRARNCRAFIDSNNPTGLKFECYVGFPDYANDGNNQLSLLVANTSPAFHRLLLTNYHRIPNWDYIDGGSQKRVTQDILPNADGVPKELGFIVSAESPTLNAAGCDDPVANFSGYFLEGRSLNTFPTVGLSALFRPSDAATGGTEITNTNYCGGNCCPPNTIFKPALGNYDPRTLEDCWDYTLTTIPTGPGYSPGNSLTYNANVSSGAISAGLDAVANWTTIVVFTQSLVRQLNPPAPSFTFTTTSTNVTCAGASNGSIEITISGGVGPYDITVNGAPIASVASSPYTLTGYSAGTYSIEVFDSTATPADNNPQSVTINDGPGFSGGIATTEYKDGCLNLVYPILNTPVTGGTSPLFVRIENYSSGYDTGNVVYSGETNLSLLGLYYPADGTNYYLIFTDANGCEYELALPSITYENPFSISGTPVNPTCSGLSDGEIQGITVTLPGAPYVPTPLTITLTGPVNATYPYTPGMNITGLPVGTYTLGVTDTYGCGNTTSITIDPAPSLLVGILLIESPTCYYECDGKVIVTGFGGNPPYTYDWSNGASGPGLTSLCVGQYEVTVTDSNGCTATSDINFAGVVFPITFSYDIEHVPAGKTSGGAIYLSNVAGGSGAPYTYNWTGPNGFTATTEDITDLEIGTYTVIICSSSTPKGGGDPIKCCITKKFIIQNQCIDFTLEELKVMLFKLQCCGGVLAKEYVQYQEIGRPDLAECKLIDLKYLTLAINTLSCINELPDACLTCEDISNILSQLKKICDCDCCDDAATGVYNVTYNPFTGQLDSN